ncbi:hypothetical protein E4T47_02669 [Aureobasidium subglaciale]|nr:hypothetical protein E4T43_03827 [Aureobasidium subglaciale]KAI5274235.1 hypothetical protein E4T47_02669 [Aureobasidium subglaciale]
MTNPHDYNAITNTISLYCIALDNKDWELLKHVFVPDVIATYPFNSHPIHGLEALSKRIQQRLAPVTTQHALTTQHLIVSDRTAKVTTYFTGVHFGRGKWLGQCVTAYGKYIDELVCVDGEEMEIAEGATGVWRIKERKVVFFGRVGEEGVMEREGAQGCTNKVIKTVVFTASSLSSRWLCIEVGITAGRCLGLRKVVMLGNCRMDFLTTSWTKRVRLMYNVYSEPGPCDTDSKCLARIEQDCLNHDCHLLLGTVPP